MLPHLAGRGLNLQRFPDGIGKAGLLAEGRAGPRAEAGSSRWSYTGHEGTKDYVVVDKVATLAWLAQEAALELHPWTSRTHLAASSRPSR